MPIIDLRAPLRRLHDASRYAIITPDDAIIDY